MNKSLVRFVVAGVVVVSGYFLLRPAPDRGGEGTVSGARPAAPGPIASGGQEGPRGTDPAGTNPAGDEPAAGRDGAEPEEGIGTGLRAPDFTLPGLDGQDLRLSDLRGKPVFINFWATWCPPCRVEMPAMQSLWEQHKSEMHIVAVNLTWSEKSVEGVRTFLRERELTFPVVLDKEQSVARRYRIAGVPTSLFLDREGIIRAISMGPMDLATMESNLRKAGLGSGGDGADAGTPPQEIVITGQGRRTRALVFGRGPYGVVLVHGAAYDAASWAPLAEKIAGAGMIALAVEESGAANVLDAIRHLKSERGVKAVALVGASAGGISALEAMRQHPERVDQLVLLSVTGDVRGLGAGPKLFVATEGEGLEQRLRDMAQAAAGDQNHVLVVPGTAHAQAIFKTEQGPAVEAAILARLEARARELAATQ